MSTWLDDVIGHVRDYDWYRPRSAQQALGWSEAGGCRAYIGYRLRGAFPEETDTWAAQRGTAVHNYVFPVLAAAVPGARTEVPTVYRGIPGHADYVEWTRVIDGKSTTLDNSKAWAEKPDLLRQKRIQVHGYAAGLVDAGEVAPDCTVGLLIMPVDGTFADWWVYEEPFDRDLADEGANRVEWVSAQLAEGNPLPKDKPARWCEQFCGFYYLCRKPGVEGDTPEAITDLEIAAAIEAYGEAHAVAAPAEAVKKALAPLIRGLRGQTASGWKVSTSREGEPGEKPDMEAIAAFYADHGGGDVPMVKTPGRAASVSVTRVKGAS